MTVMTISQQFQVLSAFHQSIVLHTQFWIINHPFSNLLLQIYFIQPQFFIVNSFFSILTQNYRITDKKGPQNSVISDKMSASAPCTTCSFFQVSIAAQIKKEFFRKVVWSTQWPRVRTLSRPCWPFLSPLVTILDFAAVSECPLRC